MNGTERGMDNVSSLLIKVIHVKILNVLLYLVNFSFEESIYPDILKSAVVALMHKNGSVVDCNNLRPISLFA